MANIPNNLLKNWQDGDIVKAVDYKTERDTIVVAHNDTDSKIKSIGDRTTAVEQSATTNAQNITSLQSSKTDKTGDHLGKWQGLVPSDFSGGQQAIDLASHKNDNTIHAVSGTTTGTNNAYLVTVSPAPTGYVQFMNVIVKCHADSTAALTLNVNGNGARSVKTSTGATVSNWKAGGIYSLRYDVASSSFILQGEGSDLSPLVTSINSILGS